MVGRKAEHVLATADMDAPHARLAALRAHHGFTPDELGKRIGCTGQTVRFIESNIRSPGRDLVLSIEALSRLPNSSGAVWPKAPLLAIEWHHHEAHATTSKPAA